MTFLSVLVFIIVYAAIATEKIPRVPAVLAGAGILLAGGALNAEQAFFSHDTGIDWNVIFLLLGMMSIVGVMESTGVFGYLGIKCAQITRGRPFYMIALLSLLTAVASALLDNVTTIMLVVPVTLAVTRQMGVSPVPMLLAEVFASNIGGAATLIGDPPNIIVASRAGFVFNDFLVNLLPVVVVSMAAFMIAIRFLFRKELAAMPTSYYIATPAADEIKDAKKLIKCGVVLGFVLLMFVTHSVTHIDASIVALVGAGALLYWTRTPLEQSVEEIEWETLVFFMGLFLMVGALVQVGVIDSLAKRALDYTSIEPALFIVGLLVLSLVLSGIVDNIPYVVAASPLVGVIVEKVPELSDAWWALALGADFGGNMTIVGASANVVMLGLAKKEGINISFWDFAKKGIPISILTAIIGAGYFALRSLDHFFIDLS